MPLIPIEHLTDPCLNAYRDVKQQNTMRNGKYFIVEGVRTVERLLASSYTTESLLIAAEHLADWEHRLPENVSAYVLPTEQASQLIGFHLHVGVMGCGLRQRTASLESLLGLPDPPRRFGPQTTETDSMTQPAAPQEITTPQTPSNGLIVVCPNCDNPENLGSIVRIASAFGAGGVLLGSACCDPFSRRVIRVSMGNIFQLPIRESRDLAADLHRLSTEWNFRLTGTVLHPAAIPLNDSPAAGRIALLLGNEAEGLTQNWIDQCHELVTIPMAEGVDSLNVAVAAGIFLHHYAPTAHTK